MSTQLAIQKTIKPPPTKTEVFDALVQLRFEEWKKKNDILSTEIESLRLKMEGAAFKLAKKRDQLEAEIKITTWGEGYISVTQQIPSSEFSEDFKRYKELCKQCSSFDEDKEKKAIREAINGAKGKRDLLTDEESRKKITALATQLGVL